MAGQADQAATINGSCHCGATGWALAGDPGPVTACNCTLCRRYGTLWAYDYVDGRITLLGTPAAFTRTDRERPEIEFLFCPSCACVVAWRGIYDYPGAKRRLAVNLRLAPPESVADLPIDHFDGLVSFKDLPSDGRTVRDMWF